mmetsp:Transcript_72071/g.199791  ORF Transcript_72071/g.199791 Transcript_72071/m.199791 type:complete len:328 (+) Transcript_72071:472-1455(+)
MCPEQPTEGSLGGRRAPLALAAWALACAGAAAGFGEFRLASLRQELLVGRLGPSASLAARPEDDEGVERQVVAHRAEERLGRQDLPDSIQVCLLRRGRLGAVAAAEVRHPRDPRLHGLPDLRRVPRLPEPRRRAQAPHEGLRQGGHRGPADVRAALGQAHHRRQAHAPLRALRRLQPPVPQDGLAPRPLQVHQAPQPDPRRRRRPPEPRPHGVLGEAAPRDRRGEVLGAEELRAYRKARGLAACHGGPAGADHEEGPPEDRHPPVRHRGGGGRGRLHLWLARRIAGGLHGRAGGSRRVGEVLQQAADGGLVPEAQGDDHELRHEALR